MKTVEHWNEQFNQCSCPKEDDDVVRAIQADALRYAAEIAGSHYQGTEWHLFYATARSVIKEAIEAEAAKLEEK